MWLFACSQVINTGSSSAKSTPVVVLTAGLRSPTGYIHCIEFLQTRLTKGNTFNFNSPKDGLGWTIYPKARLIKTISFVYT